MNNLNHKKGEASSTAIAKLNRESRILSGQDMLHPLKKFKKLQFKDGSREVTEYCNEFVSRIGMVNCSGQTVTKCTCIIDIAADLELSYAAEQCLIAHGGRIDETQKEFFWSGSTELWAEFICSIEDVVL